MLFQRFGVDSYIDVLKSRNSEASYSWSLPEIRHAVLFVAQPSNKKTLSSSTIKCFSYRQSLSISCHWFLSIPPENLWFSNGFRGNKKRTLNWNGLPTCAVGVTQSFPFSMNTSNTPLSSFFLFFKDGHLVVFPSALIWFVYPKIHIKKSERSCLFLKLWISERIFYWWKKSAFKLFTWLLTKFCWHKFICLIYSPGEG